MGERSDLIGHGRHALRFFRPYRLRIALALAGGFIAILLSHSIPLIVRHLIDVVIPAGATGSLLPTVGFLFFVVIMSATLTLTYIYLSMVVQERASLDISSMLFGRLEHASLEAIEHEQTGDLITTIDSDASRTTDYAMRLIDDIPTNVIVLSYIFVILLVMDYRLLLLSLVVVPPLVISQWRFGTLIHAQSSSLRSAFGEYLSFLEDRIRHIKLVQLFNREDDETRTFTRRGERVVKESIRVAVLQEGAVAVSTFLTHFSLALVLGVAAYLVMIGDLTIGTMVAFYGYQVSLYAPIRKLMNTHASLQQDAVSVERVRALEEQAKPLAEPEDPEPIPASPYVYSFENISLVRGERTVFSELNAAFPPGQLIGVTGASGSGKSTLLQLLYRFMDPDRGLVTLNGRDVRSYSSESYRRLVAFVANQPMLLPGSIAENIRFAQKDATQDEIEKAARFADLEDFIGSLKDGYDTSIGDLEDQLSNGQIARIAIARALIKNASLYLFDETTSGLDALTEARIQRMWWLLRSSGATVVVTSHQIRSIKHSDRIIVLADGRVAEQGTYDELMGRDSILRELDRLQKRS